MQHKIDDALFDRLCREHHVIGRYRGHIRSILGRQENANQASKIIQTLRLNTPQWFIQEQEEQQ